MKRSSIVLILVLLSSVNVFAETPEHFYNDPKKVNADPAYTPGDYPMPDPFQARSVYQADKEALSSAEAVISQERLFSLDAGEVTFTTIKNEKTPVLGYFRRFFGTIEMKGEVPTSADLLIDVNSLDTNVPGRNHRILDLFFQSAKPENGTAKVHFDRFEFSGSEAKKLSDGEEHSVKALGQFVIGQNSSPLEAVLLVQRTGSTWFIRTAEPVELLISGLGLADRVSALLEACNHRSLGNRVKVDVKLYFR